MVAAHLPTIDHTVQLTREWVRELGDRADWSEERAYRLLRVALQTLRDWLDVDEAAQFGAQLPLLLRGLYYEGWRPAKTPVADNSRDAFLSRIDAAFATDPIDDTRDAVGQVFRMLNHRISAGEVRDVRERLPAPLRDLWPEKRETEC